MTHHLIHAAGYLTIFLPFVSVFLKTGCSADLLINICLDILGWIPGVIRKSPPQKGSRTYAD